MMKFAWPIQSLAFFSAMACFVTGCGAVSETEIDDMGVAEQAVTGDLGASDLSSPQPSLTVRKAMTWALLGQPVIKSPNAYLLVGSDATTNPFQGDTTTDNALPVLCILKANTVNPGESVIGKPYKSGGAFRATWSGGTLALTPPVVGTTLTSRAVADALCASKFGTGYRMAEFHDGDASLGSGWDFWGRARGGVSSPFLEPRFWVSINDQFANPWDDISTPM